MSSITDQIFDLFLEYGYLAIFVGVMLDNSGFPVPGELVLLLTGSLVASDNFAFVPAALVAALGATLSDSLWYYAGKKGSRRLMHLYCRVSFGSTACVAKTERHLNRFGPRSLLYARFLPGFRTFAAPMAGMAGMSYRQFLLYDGIGAMLWANIGVAIGMVFSHKVDAMFGLLDQSRIVLLYLLGRLLLLFILMKWLVRRHHGRAQLPLE